MAASMLQNCSRTLNRLTLNDKTQFFQQVRSYFRIRYRGKSHEEAKSWKQRKAEIEEVDPEKSLVVNIGFRVKSQKNKMTRTDLRLLKKERNNVELERLSRHRQLIVPVEEIQKEEFFGAGQKRIHTVADHYGIYRDLFGEAYFYPQFKLGVGYSVAGEEDMVNPVLYGNLLTPTETNTAPAVQYEGDATKFYTLCMTAPDSHLEERDSEYMHWMISNIPGSAVNEGEVLFDYLPLFPVHGTGCHRYVFILYQHDNKVDFSVDKVQPNSTSLAERTFNTLEFYRKHQEQITPVGLCFFQAEWDQSVREVFHNTLDMDEPRYEFIQPLAHVEDQKYWPIREPFHAYMDRYRDVKDIGEEVLREKLKTTDPFKPRTPRPKYPNLQRLGHDTPSWLKVKMVEKRNRLSYWKYLDD